MTLRRVTIGIRAHHSKMRHIRGEVSEQPPSAEAKVDLVLDVAQKLEAQEKVCAAKGSLFTSQLLHAALSDYRQGRRVRDMLDGYPWYTRPGLNLAAALHFLALQGEPTLSKHYPSVGGDGDANAAWGAARSILAKNPGRIESLFQGTVQTNDPARSMPILGAFLEIAAHYDMPIRMFEVGASAGLNLQFDRYRYEEADWSWGDIGSPLVLSNCTRRGRPKYLHANLKVVERRGCDLSPINLSSPTGRLRLLSFVWADQKDRMTRARCAINVAANLPVRIDAEDFSTWLPREVEPRRESVTVILHTVFEEHLSASARSTLRHEISAIAKRATASAPLAHVRMEQGRGVYTTDFVTLGDGSKLKTAVCASDGHAQGIVWR